MASDHDHRLLPLRREFGQAWHGFDRNQVVQYLDHLEAQVHRLMTERDTAMARAGESARELDSARKEIATLRDRVEELKKPPERVEDLDERMQRSVQLAESQAAEVLARAEAAAEKNWAESSEVSKKLHERYMALLETLDGHADQLKREHEEALAATKAEVQRMTTEAARRREHLDTEAERKRRRIENDFQAKVSAEKSALEKHIADQQTASKNAAERRIADATAEAKRLVDEATAKAKKLVDEATGEADRRTTEANEVVGRLTKIREEARARLAEADKVLRHSESALTATPDEEAALAEAPGRS
ncbi:cell division protein DivIVA [Saccharomonospora piscinae]|uniref:Cell division protein DivIVA n=1 Tax=Saccharomonospora piscinae TaxID=687388 RepID=A0A1V9A5R5_SACPI|nr:cell division protein DivIVA [Saccharomonospora piscinae]OQO92482.1 cell division protein DivIVA [Saccharomonospora piscinae]